MRILGIDPGKTGALAIIRGGALEVVADLPTVEVPYKRKSRAIVSPSLMFDMLLNLGAIDVAYIEDVGARQTDGSVAAFRFGRTVGTIHAVVACRGIRIEFVRPQLWKKDLSLNSDAEVSRSKALELWPDQSEFFRRKMDHNRAEAALIAEWGRRQQ